MAPLRLYTLMSAVLYLGADGCGSMLLNSLATFVSAEMLTGPSLLPPRRPPPGAPDPKPSEFRSRRSPARRWLSAGLPLTLAKSAGVRLETKASTSVSLMRTWDGSSTTCGWLVRVLACVMGAQQMGLRSGRAAHHFPVSLRRRRQQT